MIWEHNGQIVSLFGLDTTHITIARVLLLQSFPLSSTTRLPRARILQRRLSPTNAPSPHSQNKNNMLSRFLIQTTIIIVTPRYLLQADHLSMHILNLQCIFGFPVATPKQSSFYSNQSLKHFKRKINASNSLSKHTCRCVIFQLTNAEISWQRLFQFNQRFQILVLDTHLRHPSDST